MRLNDTNLRKGAFIMESLELARETLKQHLSDSRELSAALTKLDEAEMWAARAVENAQRFIDQGIAVTNGMGRKI